MKALNSTLAWILYFIIGIIVFVIAYSLPLILVIIYAVFNVIVGIMITYNALVANNKRTIEDMLKQ